MSKNNQKLGVVAFWLAWPGLWLYLRWSRRTRLVLQVGDEILVNKSWLSDGRWGLPGGGLHRGENPAAGVIRETLEETGIRLQPGQVKELGARRYSGRGLRFACRYFTAELSAKPAIVLQQYEISAAQWVNLTDVASDPAAARKYGPDVLAGIAMLQ